MQSYAVTAGSALAKTGTWCILSSSLHMWRILTNKTKTTKMLDSDWFLRQIPHSAFLKFAASGNPQATAKDRFIFPQRHRLRLAVNLACSVLQFHRSWLKAQWRARDIMFTAKTSADIENPYVLWNMMNGDKNIKQKSARFWYVSTIAFTPM
ncbi:hypothetical protein PENFLA_c072G05455 [Penicillium flavigenum]|uniref:DUF7580 domain-containing protein n=1 Tax=Penicillium flavigenum TaxID=254877 RepID=A0A1V6SBC2_9EURO|nr:hypothetical protein PENFLA_c072G05455 [Penicillium flavigenum]